MAKFSGRVGFSVTSETSPGIWESTISWRRYKGDVLKNSYRWERSDSINDNVKINNHVSIVADSFAIDNLGMIKCVEVNNSKWNVVEVQLQYPRIILYLGDLYHEQ